MKIKKLFCFEVKVFFANNTKNTFEIKVSADDESEAEKICKSYFAQELSKAGQDYNTMTCVLKSTDKYIEDREVWI